MTQDELNVILEKHQKWMNGGAGGERACLHRANLSGLDLSGAQLSYADLTQTNLYNTNLHRTCLFKSDLIDADIQYADLRGAQVSYANLSHTNLAHSNLSNAELTSANLSYAKCRCTRLDNTILADAILSHARLGEAILSKAIGLPPIACPEEGSFIGYKAALTVVNGDQINCIVKLRITEDAKRSSATTRKCRCSKAEVMSITTVDGEELGVAAYSYKHPCFIYGVGNTVEVSDFDENRWNECSTGIHFFLSRSDAVNWIVF